MGSGTTQTHDRDPQEAGILGNETRQTHPWSQNTASSAGKDWVEDASFVIFAFSKHPQSSVFGG